jgi:hypothetical protein
MDGVYLLNTEMHSGAAMMNPRIVTFLLAIGALAFWRFALYRKRHDDMTSVSTGSSRWQLS